VNVDEDGSFSISPVAAGDYGLTIRRGAVGVATRDITVVEGELTEIDVTLP